MNDLNSAFDNYYQANILDPNNVDVYVELGDICLEMDDPDCAVDYFNQAIELDPGNVPAHTRRGSAYWAMGEYEKARTDMDYD